MTVVARNGSPGKSVEDRPWLHKPEQCRVAHRHTIDSLVGELGHSTTTDDGDERSRRRR
jgi:hypothetical protein